jgi:ABC-type transport system involved in cytochrome bd biosynthesis fused ATPase/permease subunit
MIHIRDLTFYYREEEFRLNIPQFKVAAGGRVAVIGPGGSGKTTLLNLIPASSRKNPARSGWVMSAR